MKKSLLTIKQWSYIQKKYWLTPREFSIVKLVCVGLSNKNIAKKLGIASGTAKTHIRNVYRKMHRMHNELSMLLRFVEESKSVKK